MLSTDTPDPFSAAIPPDCWYMKVGKAYSCIPLSGRAENYRHLSALCSNLPAPGKSHLKTHAIVVSTSSFSIHNGLSTLYFCHNMCT